MTRTWAGEAAASPARVAFGQVPALSGPGKGPGKLRDYARNQWVFPCPELGSLRPRMRLRWSSQPPERLAGRGVVVRVMRLKRATLHILPGPQRLAFLIPMFRRRWLSPAVAPLPSTRPSRQRALRGGLAHAAACRRPRRQPAPAPPGRAQATAAAALRHPKLSSQSSASQFSRSSSS